ncbi:MAG: hypothetical protein QM741_11150 [Rudaea sp.]|uniref:hypothetical protein n=1 Tax=Rudaea sp. TaxID=2136325 RepID=UPI0039E6D75F
MIETVSAQRSRTMPRGDKSAYTEKQKRQALHIEQGYESRGVDEVTAAARAWATVNKESGGGKLSGSGRRTQAAAKKKAPAAKSAPRKSTAKKPAASKSPRKR